MRSLYLLVLSTSAHEYLEHIVDNMLEKHGKSTIFSPIAPKDYDKPFSFEDGEAAKAYTQDKNAFFAKIIGDFERLKREFDFVLVMGSPFSAAFGCLEPNVAIAKELNSPICALVDEGEKAAISAYLREKLQNRPFLAVSSKDDLKGLETLADYDFLTPNRFSYELLQMAKAEKKTIVLPESDDERILRAAGLLLTQDAVRLILLGDEGEIQSRAKKLGVNLSGAQVFNPKNSPLNAEFAATLYEARKAKGMSEDEAARLVLDRTYFGTLLVHTNKADAMVSGASTTTAETIRPALQLIKTKEGISTVSGAFFMSLSERVLLFADCAVTPNPTPQQLADIAFVSATTAQAFGFAPRVAMLSYSTGSSGSGVSVDAVKEAVAIAREKYPNLTLDGPLQFDAAIDPTTAKSKMPDSKVAGQANVFIFPDLNAANIAYKAVQRSANALAIGPILQGLKKPVNDLSRGCLVEDVVSTVILSAIQAQK